MTKEKELVDLNEYEISLVDDLIYNAKEYVKNRMLISVPIIIVLSFIPLSFLPSRRIQQTGLDKSQNLIETLGFLPWLLIFIAIFALAVWLMLHDKKLFALQKDQVDLKKEKLTSVVKEKMSYPENDHYVIFVNDTDAKEVRIHLSESQYNEYKVGDKIEVEILKNSKIVV